MTVPTIRPGELRVDVVADAAGRTRTASLRQRYPQRVSTALRCEREYPGAAKLCVQSPSGGAFSDDDLHTTVRCDTGTHLHLTTQAATQVFAGDGPGARHHVELSVRDGSVLEYYPGTVIPHADSTFVQHIDIDVEHGGVYLGWEAVAAGRIAHGERYEYTCYDSAFVLKVNGRVVGRDRQVIRPHTSAGTLIDGDYLATFVVAAPGRDHDAMLHRLRAVVGPLGGCHGGAGQMPSDAGVFVRLTAQAAPDLHRARRCLFATARTELIAARQHSSKVSE